MSYTYVPPRVTLASSSSTPGQYLPKAISGFDGQGHSGSHGSKNKNSDTHDPEYFSFRRIRPEDQFVNISGKHGRC